MEYLKERIITISEGEKLRCDCNKLLCITKGNNIEIKCNKCKRLLIIKTKGIIDIEIKNN